MFRTKMVFHANPLLTVNVFRIFSGIATAKNLLQTFKHLIQVLIHKMDAIRKKMESLKAETKDTLDKIKELETAAINDNDREVRANDLLKHITRKYLLVEKDFDETLEKYKSASLKLESVEVAYDQVDEESNAMARRVMLLEDEEIKSTRKLAQVVLDLAKMSMEADNQARKVKQLEQRNIQDEEATEALDAPTREAKRLNDDSEAKLEEMSRRLGALLEEYRRTQDRAVQAEMTIVGLETELKTVGENMKELEVSEEKAILRQERYQSQIHALLQKLKEAEGRYEYGEMNITKLNHRIDDLEDEICREKARIKALSDDLNDVFESILTKY